MKKRKVLLVDDEPDFLKLIGMRLKAHGYDLVTTANGKECFEQAKRSLPDIIILDIMMPGLDGIATTLKLKSIKETRSIPIIISTAVKENDDEIVAQNLGVVDYIRKPFKGEELIAKIEEVLSK